MSRGCKKLLGALAIKYYAFNQLILIRELTNQLLQLSAIILYNIKHGSSSMLHQLQEQIVLKHYETCMLISKCAFACA